MKQCARLRTAALAAGIALAGTSAAVVAAGAADPTATAPSVSAPSTLPAACAGYVVDTPLPTAPSTTTPSSTMPSSSAPSSTMPPSSAPSSTMPSSSVPTTAVPQAFSPTDVGFVRFAVQSALDEIAVGTVAASQADDAGTRAFAQRMVDEHTVQLRQVQSLAEAVQLTVPTAPSAELQLALDDLEELDGSGFDHAYLMMQAHAHHRAFEQFAAEALHGDNDCAQSWAAASLPLLGDHLRVAADLLIGAASAPDTSTSTTVSGSTSSTSSTPPSSDPAIPTVLPAGPTGS